MKISYNWLKEYIDFDYSPDELKDILTMLGLEIGTVKKLGGIEGGLQGVVVGHVLSAEQHPNADRLRVCQVDIGGEAPLHIVCGAPNVAAGQKVPVATVGTVLHPKGAEKALKIKKGKIRGEVSEGMICAEDELGIGHDHDGIVELDASAEIGSPAIQYFELEEDYVLEIDLTPNRIDGASHYGAARDLAAYMRSKANLPAISLKKEALTKENPIPVRIEDPDRCKRYTSIYIEGVTVQESPDWLKNRLEAIGLRPINNVVDLTNYVLHELGQPMHAFDADQLKGGEIIVKTLPEKQKFMTLDEIERELLPHTDLMICDAERPLCIGGTMGGLNSGVTFETKNVFLEAAYFDAGSVRKTAKRLDIHSDSSFRFERGADPHMTEIAALRCASLIVEIAGGTASKVADLVVGEFPHFDVDLSISKTNRLIGKEIPRGEIIDILQHLEIEVQEDSNTDLLHLKVPPYRVDVQRDVDVIEDILRVYGYNSVDIPAEMKSTLQFGQQKNPHRLREYYSNALSASGFYEVMNNSLVDVRQGDEQAVPIVNPLGPETGMMRQSMLPGILETIRFNQNRQQEDIAIYEYGKTYGKTADGYVEDSWCVLAVAGHRHGPHWEGAAPKVSLSRLSKEVERLEKWFSITISLSEYDDAELEYGLQGKVGDQQVLQYGQVRGALAEAYDLRNDVFYMRINWAVLTELYYQRMPKFQPIPLYPSIRRDLSLLIDEMTSFEELAKSIRKANPKLIRNIALHDIYRGKGIPEGKKSYLIQMEFRDDHKTLADKAAEKISQRVAQLLKEDHGAEIRK